MVAVTPNEELQHHSRVDQLREADKVDVATNGKTLTGREAVNQAITQMMTPIHQLSTDTCIEPRVVEQLKSEAHELRQKGEATDAQNDLFVLAGEMHRLGQRAADLMIA